MTSRVTGWNNDIVLYVGNSLTLVAQNQHSSNSIGRPWLADNRKWRWGLTLSLGQIYVHNNFVNYRRNVKFAKKNSHVKVPYSSGKFSQVQIFAEKCSDCSEEIFAVFTFAECRTLWPHSYRLMRHLRTVSYEFVSILYSRRLIRLYSNLLD